MATPIAEQDAVFNSQDYIVKIFLSNGDQQFQINPNAIVNLSIEETLADWVTRGTLTIYYSFEMLEIDPEPGMLGRVNPYSFRNDGNDILTVSILPNFERSQSQQQGQGSAGLQSFSIDKVHWKLNYEFSIYEMEDIDLPPGAQNAASAANKAKKFYFYDAWNQLMISDFMEFSTALTTQGLEQIAGFPETSIPDYARSVPTGYAIQEVIKKCLVENAGLSENIVSTEDWDEGSSKIFYTAPNPWTAADSLDYLYNRHVSTANNATIAYDFAILTKERGPTEDDFGKFVLRPVSKFFEKAGTTVPKEFQIEHFYIQENTAGSNIPSTNHVPLAAGNNGQIDTKLGAYSYITNYRFVDIPSIINTQNFRTKSLHSIDFLNRTFYIEYSPNKAELAREFMLNQYINNVASDGTSNENFLITLNDRKRGRNIEPAFSLYGGNTFDDFINRQADGLQKLLKTGLFLNSCINFRVLGSTNRETGRFVAIDSLSEMDDNAFTNKFYGQWFVINVKHVFEAGLYYNDITAIKTHRFKGTGRSSSKTI